MSEQSMVVKIEPTPLRLREPALRLMRLGRARTRRLLEAAWAGAIDMEGLFHAQRQETTVGAVWGQRVPGSLAFCWPAALAAGEPEHTAELLHAAVNRYLDEAGIRMAQAMLPVQDVLSAMRLVRAGYEHLLDLDCLASSSETFPKEPPRRPFTVLAGWRGRETRLKALIERTYENTLDCTSLGSVRSMDDVLDGYRHTGVFRSDWWVIARHKGADIGCVLLADHPEHNQCELMYLGVVPEQRGKGWGMQLTRLAQWIALQAHRQQIVLAVDDGNRPARRLYERAGFDAWDRRSVYVRAMRAQREGKIRGPSSTARARPDEEP
ncbi:MAG: GNAT family N-acetyltransferase [Planctomycetota bacterium]